MLCNNAQKQDDYTLSYLINRNLRVHFDLTQRRCSCLNLNTEISSDDKQEYGFFFPPRIFPHCYKGVLLSQCIAVWVNRGSELKKQREIDHNYQNSKNFFFLYHFETKMNSAIKCMFLLTCINLCASHSKWNPFSYSSFLFFILIFTVLYLPVSG